MKCTRGILGGWLLLAACASASSPKPASEPARPELRTELRIVSLPIVDDLEELGAFSRMGLPMDIFASISAGEEPLVSKVVSRATLISITKGTEGQSSSVMLAVPREDVEVLILTRDLARKKQASLYLVAGPRGAPTAPEGREKSLQLRQMLARLGYELPERRPPPPGAEAPEPKPRPLAQAPKPEPPAPEPPPRALAVKEPPLPAPAPAPAPPKADPPPSPVDELALPERLPEGRLFIDGSSTVFPMAKLLRDEFMRRYPDVHVELMGVNPGESPSGSGGGFKRFCFGETDISNSSRFIKDDEVRKCASNNIPFLELPLAYDGLSVVVNRENSWAKSLTVTELRAIWEQASQIQTWHEIRPEFPRIPLKLFSPGRDNGTYDYFMEAILGSAEASPRQDLVASTTPEILAREINASAGALGYFGLAYYVEHRDSLRLLGIDSGKGPVLPTHETVLDGSYTPLSRPLFMYVKATSLKRPEVRAFVRYCMREISRVAQAVGYIPLPTDLGRMSQERLLRSVEGSMRPVGQPAGPLGTLMRRP